MVHGVTQVDPPETDAREGLEGMDTSLGGSRRVVVSSGLRFTDKDEHMYFWFPLLAGLSELTFDPRADIRYGLLRCKAVKAIQFCLSFSDWQWQLATFGFVSSDSA